MAVLEQEENMEKQLQCLPTPTIFPFEHALDCHWLNLLTPYAIQGGKDTRSLSSHDAECLDPIASDSHWYKSGSKEGEWKPFVDVRPSVSTIIHENLEGITLASQFLYVVGKVHHVSCHTSLRRSAGSSSEYPALSGGPFRRRSGIH